MKYLEKMMEMGCFTRQDVVLLTGSEPAAHSLLYDYKKNGYVESIKRNYYTAISLETKQPVANRFRIASGAAGDACISHHSAFEYFGYANQVYHEVYISSKRRFSDFTFDGITYRRVAPRIDSEVIESRDGIRVTGLERTVVDSIHDVENIGGLEELLRCLALVPALRSDRLIKCLDAYGQGLLFQKTGYICSQFSTDLGLQKDFFDYCQTRISASKKYLLKGRDSLAENLVWHDEWRLYAPENLRRIINKGVVLDG